MEKQPNTPTMMDKNFDSEKYEVDSPYLTLLHNFDNLLCSGDWEFPDPRSLTIDLWNEAFKVEYSLL